MAGQAAAPPTCMTYPRPVLCRVAASIEQQLGVAKVVGSSPSYAAVRHSLACPQESVCRCLAATVVLHAKLVRHLRPVPWPAELLLRVARVLGSFAAAEIVVAEQFHGGFMMTLLLPELSGLAQCCLIRNVIQTLK